MAQAAAGSGGAVFNSTPGTPRLVPDPGTDHLLPPAGALNYGSISSLTALLTTNGVATSLVHGDHFEMMNGNEFRTITLDRDHTILGNQYSTVKEDRHDVVESNYNQQVVGATQRFHNGATNEQFCGEHGNEHESDRHLNEPEKVWHFINERVESGNKLTKSYGAKVEVASSKVDIVLGVNADYKSINLGFATVGVEGHTAFSYEFGPMSAETREIKADIKALEGDVRELQSQLAESDLNAQVLFLTPFGLGVYV